MKSAEVFYLHIEGEQRGPYTVPQIDHLLNSGLISEDTLFWREGLEQWEPVTSLVVRRKPEKRWLRPAIMASIVLVLAVFLRIFGPITIDGWREASQWKFTEEAAYWRARDVIRTQALPPKAIVRFLGFGSAYVELKGDSGADAIVRGKLTDARGQTGDAAWRVQLRYDGKRKEWTGQSVEKIPHGL